MTKANEAANAAPPASFVPPEAVGPASGAKKAAAPAAQRPSFAAETTAAAPGKAAFAAKTATEPFNRAYDPKTDLPEEATLLYLSPQQARALESRVKIAAGVQRIVLHGRAYWLLLFCFAAMLLLYAADVMLVNAGLQNSGSFSSMLDFFKTAVTMLMGWLFAKNSWDSPEN